MKIFFQSFFSAKFKRGMFFLLFLAPLWGVGGLAQTYPVQVNVYALPPYSNQLSDYYTTTREKLVVALLNRDHLRPNLEVELLMTISAGSGLKIQNRQGVYYPTITLTEGVLTRLTQDDLAPYLQPQNITQQGYMNQGKLPEGMIEFTFQAIEKYTRKSVSLPATARVWLSSEKPPLLSLPSNNEMIGFTEPLNLKFQWTPQHRSISQVEYEFELRELPNNGAAPQSAFLYSPVIYSERLRFTNLMYTPLLPLLDPNKTYGWRVRAIAKDGVDEINMFENNGFSEIWFFRTQITCLSPAGCRATVRDNNVDLSWTAGKGNTEYVVQYRSKTATSAEWTTVNTNDVKAVLRSLPRSTTYEYRIGGVCEFGGQPVFAPVSEATIGARSLSNCGVAPQVDLGNRELLPELKAGDIVTVGGDFPMTVTRVTGGSNGIFAGEGWTPINWVFEAKFAVEFDDLMINTDYRQIGGKVRGKYDKNNSQIADLDAFTDGGTVQNTRNGVIMPNIELNFVLPEDPLFFYNEATGELMVFDTNNNLQRIEMPKNDGKTVFPVIVKDKEGNLYKVEEESGDAFNEDGMPATGADSTKPLTATYLGKQGEPLPSTLDTGNIAYNTATVTFSKGAGKFAFDEWQDYYGKVSIIESKDVYDHLNGGSKRYDVAWKLLPAGESDVVEAKIEIKDTKLDPETVIFSTPQGTIYKYTYDKSEKSYTLTLAAGKDGDVQEIYALNKLNSENYQTLGKLNVITYKKQTPKVVVVGISGNKIDNQALKTYLDEVYNSVGVNWQVETDTFTYAGVNDRFFEESSKLLTAYNDNMNKLQAAYKQARGGIESKTCYIFVLNKSGVEKNRNTAGFMPRGKQFGYIFLDNIDRKGENNVVAHELGHGQWKFKHVFEAVQALQGTTNNLMDYKNGILLGKWQWDQMSEPAIFDGIFDKDADAMISNNAKLTNSVCISEEVSNVLIVKGYALAPNGNYFKVPDDAVITSVFKQDISQNPAAAGSVLSFIHKGTNYYSYFYNKDGSFAGYGITQQSSKASLLIKDTDLISADDEYKQNIDFPDNNTIKINDKTYKTVKCFDETNNTKSEFFRFPANYPNFVIENPDLKFDDEIADAVKKLNALVTKTKSAYDYLTEGNDLSYIHCDDGIPIERSDLKKLDMKFAYLADYTASLNKPVKIYVVLQKIDKIKASDWSGYTKEVYEKSNLNGTNSLLITLPYFSGGPTEGTTVSTTYSKNLRCFMPGMYGTAQINKSGIVIRDIEIKRESASSYGEFYVGVTETQVVDFVNDVYKQTAKPSKVHVGYLHHDASISYKGIESTGYTSGADFCKKIVMLKHIGFEQIKRLEYPKKYLSIPNPYGGTSLPNPNYEKELLIYQLQYNAICENADENKAGDWLQVTDDAIYFKEKYIDENAENYLRQYAYKSGFKQWAIDLNNTLSTDFADFKYTTAHTYNKDKITALDPVVYGVVDVAGLVLTPFGLDAIADGAGAGYAVCRGQTLDAAMYSASIVMVGVSGGTLHITKTVGKELDNIRFIRYANNLYEKTSSGFIKVGKSEAGHKIIKDFFDLPTLSSSELNAFNKALNEGKIASEDIAKILKETDEAVRLRKFKEVGKITDDILANGKFIDNVLETDYQKYLARKAKESKAPKDRLEWKEARDYWLYDSPMARGNAFNDKALQSQWYDYNEVTLQNGKRLDSYTPPSNGQAGQIVSRKATSLEDIELSTFESYLKELKTKYPIGEPINAPKFGNDLKGKVLEGQHILEIPESNRNFGQIQEYIDLAKNKYNIEIKFRPE